jgi:hypothetical protein
MHCISKVLFESGKDNRVGLELGPEKCILYLPIGFPIPTTDKKKEAYFLLRGCFSAYGALQEGKIKPPPAPQQERQNLQQVPTSGRATKEMERAEAQEGFQPLDGLSRLLNLYDEPRIRSMVWRWGLVKELDWGCFDRYLGHALFDDDGRVYIPEGPGASRGAGRTATEIIGLYAFLMKEILPGLWEMPEEHLDPDLLTLADAFSRRYLSADGGLFENEDLGDELRKALELIDQRTAMKEPDYFDFYDAIHDFLYEGQKEKNSYAWGAPFYDVWEALCLDWIEAKREDFGEIIAMDRGTLQGSAGMEPVGTSGLHLNKNDRGARLGNALLENNRYGTKGIHLRPDCVLFHSERHEYQIIDAKAKKSYSDFCVSGTWPEDKEVRKDWLDWFNKDVLTQQLYYASVRKILRDEEKQVSTQLWVPTGIDYKSKQYPPDDLLDFLSNLTIVGKDIVKLMKSFKERHLPKAMGSGFHQVDTRRYSA